MSAITIHIVEDHDMFREGIRYVLAADDAFDVVAESSNGAEFLGKLKEDSLPDLVLMDINLPDMSGIEVVKRSLLIDSSLKFVAVTMFDNVDVHIEIQDAGFWGGILKNKFTNQIEQVFESLNQGEKFFPVLNKA